jgi:signal transduction histidine kinase
MDNLRRELVANVSHDLRTPLTVMQGYIETLQIKKGSLNDVQNKEYLYIIKKSIKQLTQLVSQLFEYSKLEAKQVKPQKEPFALTDLIYDIQNKYELIAKQKNISLTTKFSKQTPLVFADIGLVERAIQNLMDNALKFTPDSGEILISATEKEKDLLVSVCDNGVGINPKYLYKVFNEFEQLGLSNSPKYGGTGLGLNITQKIVELHKGKIWVESKGSNKGSCFYVQIPQKQ